MRTQKQTELFSAPTPKSPLSSFSHASKTMTNSHSSKIFCQYAKKNFTKCSVFWHYSGAVAKSTAEPENSNYLSTAQNTPIACFFMRSAHAPQKRLVRPSMVACSGKGFALCCFPLMTVSQPVTRYRPSLRTLAVTSNQFINGVTQMYQFIFAAIRRTDLTNHIQKIRITADSEHNARAKLAREFVLVLAGRINLQSDCTLSANTFPSISFAEVDHA